MFLLNYECCGGPKLLCSKCPIFTAVAASPDLIIFAMLEGGVH